MNPIKSILSFGKRLQSLETLLEQYQTKNTHLESAIEEMHSKLSIVNEHSNQINQIQADMADVTNQFALKQWETFWRIYSEWWSWGATHHLLEEFNYIERFDTFWENELPSIWLIYICCLLECGDKAHALTVLRKYLHRFGDANISRYLPVASLYAECQRQIPDSIATAQTVRDFLLKRQKDHLFETYVKQALSIAVVGNSNREIGKGLGTAIDSHDIVIRFNNYEGKPPEDYGHKTTVWVRNGSPDCPDFAEKMKFDYVIWADDYEHTFVQGNLLNLLARDIESRNYIAVTIPATSHLSLRKSGNLLNPTSGAYLIYYLSEILKSFRHVDFYGFSFVDDAITKGDCHTDDLLNWHEMSTEIPFLQALISRIR